MGSISFRIRVIMRVILFGTLVFSFFYAWMQQEWYVTSIVLGILSIISLIELIRFFERWNVEFNSLLQSVRNRDFTNVYPALSGSKKEFRQAFDELTSVYQEIKLEKEVHYQYLQQLIENIKVAILCFDDSGAVISVNTTAKELLGLPALQHIDAIRGRSSDLYNTIVRTSAPVREQVTLNMGGDLLQLSVNRSRFKIGASWYVLLSLQNIRFELDGREVETWKKMIRVLTHEIMNSVTPITSLSTTLRELLRGDDGLAKKVSAIESEDLDDLYCGIQTIESRSSGLTRFVNSYKSLTRLPDPSFVPVRISELMASIRKLMEPVLSSKGIVLLIDQPDKMLTMNIDRAMVEQAVINLITNSAEAVTETKNKVIRIGIFTTWNGTVIEVLDNGKGIEIEHIHDIFVPFFSTKGHGSGIGLSLSRQIMALHAGTISVRSNPGVETVFTLHFPDK